MTWEPEVLMPDPATLGSEHVIRSHNYVGAVTADMFHTNAFVMNGFQFFDWQDSLEMSLWSSEATELLPSYTSRSRWEQSSRALDINISCSSLLPTPAGKPQAKLVSRVYSEAAPRDVPVSSHYYCFSLVVVNPSATPTPVQCVVDGMATAASMPGTLVATRLFSAQYSVNFTSSSMPQHQYQNTRGTLSPGTVDCLYLNDFVDARGSNVYRIGCDVGAFVPHSQSRGGGGSDNYVMSGNFEGSVVDTKAGRFNMKVGGFGAGYFPILNTTSDDRTRVTADTADPHGGRYAAKINLGSAVPVVVGLPVNKSIPAGGTYTLRLWARSSPSGVALSVQALGVTVVTSTLHAGGWQEIVAAVRYPSVPPVPPPSTAKYYSPVLVVMTSHLTSGGTVWLDDISLV